MEHAWSVLMSVGNKSIDAEHKLLLKMINDIEMAIIKRDSAGLLNAILLFEQAVESHFRNEANIARAINFPFDGHIVEHRYVLNEIQSMRAELVSREGRWSESAVEHYYGFLSKWATMHIDEDDMRMKAVLDTLPYDFTPPLPSPIPVPSPTPVSSPVRLSSPVTVSLAPEKPSRLSDTPR